MARFLRAVSSRWRSRSSKLHINKSHQKQISDHQPTGPGDAEAGHLLQEGTLDRGLFVVIIDPVLILLIQGAVLLLTHLKETGAGAGHTLHITVADAGDHTHHTKAVDGPILVLAPLTADHQFEDASQIIIAGGAAALLDLTPPKMVITGEADTILGLIAQKTVTTGGTDTTRGTILQATELHTDGTDIIHPSTGHRAGTEAGVGLFLEVCLLLQRDITGATLVVSLQLGHGEASRPDQEARS